ncbi:MAG: polyprenol monophosphomannose synthase [Candidatus Omnitrophica bacterium]|nr:polyprenol monophosphomannose synthase [Candidatus Omnitrophota bacterium]
MKAVVLIATYNEVLNMERVLDGIQSSVASTSHDVHVLVVDDDSPDGTGKLLDELKDRYPGKLHVIHRKNQRGCGSARRLGFREALKLKPDCVIEMDGDGSHNPRYLPLFLNLIQNYDVVIGSRYVEGGAVVHWPLKRKIISLIANQIYRTILGSKIHDLSGGFKAYRYEMLQQLPFEEFLSNGYSIGIETIFRCYKKGASFLEVPVVFANREKGNSKFRWKEAFEALRILITLVLRFGRAIRIFDFEQVDSASRITPGKKHEIQK